MPNVSACRASRSVRPKFAAAARAASESSVSWWAFARCCGCGPSSSSSEISSSALMGEPFVLAGARAAPGSGALAAAAPAREPVPEPEADLESEAEAGSESESELESERVPALEEEELVARCFRLWCFFFSFLCDLCRLRLVSCLCLRFFGLCLCDLRFLCLSLFLLRAAAADDEDELDADEDEDEDEDEDDDEDADRSRLFDRLDDGREASLLASFSSPSRVPLPLSWSSSPPSRLRFRCLAIVRPPSRRQGATTLILGSQGSNEQSSSSGEFRGRNGGAYGCTSASARARARARNARGYGDEMR